MVRSKLEVPGQIEVILIRYGYFDAFRFWFPFWTRNKPIERVYEQIRVALQKYRRSHPDAKLSIIAHSFGTYIIGEILKRGFDLQIDRLLLCGSVLPQGFLWHQYQGRFDDDKVVNECGKADIWPVLAQSASWGYGASGTHGFGAVLVKDRFHAGGHGQYFKPEFVEKYWEPFIRRGVYQGTEFETKMPATPWWISVLGILPFNWLLALVLTALFVYFPYYVIKSYVGGNAPKVIKAENLPTWTNNYDILRESLSLEGSAPIGGGTPVRYAQKQRLVDGLHRMDTSVSSELSSKGETLLKDIESAKTKQDNAPYDPGHLPGQ